MEASRIKASMSTIRSNLEAVLNGEQAVVVMMCGIAGSGKTTLSKAVLQEIPGFIRLSKDEIVCERHGIFGQDYDADDHLYASYLAEAEDIFLLECSKLLDENKNIVLDRSFYAKEDREQYRTLVEKQGAKCVLFYLNPGEKERSWMRICERASRAKDANNAYRITRDTFDAYWAGFEIPVNEGAVTIDIH